MADTTDTTEGAQPLAAPEAASWSLSTAQPVPDVLQYSGDAPLPPEGEEGSRTTPGAGDLPSGTDDALHPSQDETSVDELIATLPARVVEALTARDIEALASGDPQAVARILLPEIPDENGNENSDDTPLPQPEAALPAQPQADSGPERISLRGIPAKDRIALADMVRAVKEGRFASLDEARAAMQPETVAEPAARAEAHEAQQQTSEPALAHGLQRIAHLKSLQKEAADAFDTATVLHLTEAITAATLELQQAESAAQSAQQQMQHWNHHEAQQIASVQQQFAAELADEAFSKALLDERDLAEVRGDPILHVSNWPTRLAERARQRVQRQAATGARPQARARGMVASPSARGASLSEDEAFEQIEGMSESEVDAVLSQMREREKASRFTRAG